MVVLHIDLNVDYEKVVTSESGPEFLEEHKYKY